MAVRRSTGTSCGGGNKRPACQQQAGSLRPSTNGSGPRNSGWNGCGNSNSRYNQNNNRTNNFLLHQPVHFQDQSQGDFRQANPRRRQNRRFQNQQSGGFSATDRGHGHPFQQFQHNASNENPVPLQTGFQDHLGAPIPRGPKNRRRRNHRNQTDAYRAFGAFNAVLDVGRVDASHLDTDIEMPDAPPLECSSLDTWINEPTLLVAEALASANDMLARIEYFVRTGTMPADNFNFNG